MSHLDVAYVFLSSRTTAKNVNPAIMTNGVCCQDEDVTER